MSDAAIAGASGVPPVDPVAVKVVPVIPTGGPTTALGVPLAPAAAPAPAPAGSGAPAEGSTPPADGDPKVFDESYVKELRAEAARRRVREKELETELTELKAKGMTLEQQQAMRLKQLEDDNRNLQYRQRTSEIKAQAAALGCKKPELVIKLVDDDVPDEDIAKIVQQLKKEHPELFANVTGSADGGAGRDGGTIGRTINEGMNSLIRGVTGR